MVRRKHISLAERIGNMQKRILPIPPPDNFGVVSIQKALSDKFDDIRAAAAKEALSKYNATDFKPIIVEQPDATYVAPIGNINEQVPKSKRTIINGSRTPVKSYIGKQREFVNDIYNSYYRNLIAGGSSPDDAKRQARHLAQKSAYETGYGQSIYAKHNYGGHEVPDGKGGVRKLTFTSMDDYTKADIKLLDRKWKPWRNAKNEDEFVTAITTDYGQGRYNAVNNKYRNTYKGMSKRMNSYLNMRCGGRTERPKAWVGAVIGAASSLFGSILNADAQKKQLEEQRRIQAHKDAVVRAENMTQALGLMQNAQEEYEDRFRLPYAKGGRRRLRDGVSITDGGYAIPIGQNTFLLRGGSHEDINETGQTGIGINIGGKEIEAEGGEVVQKTPKEVRVFSDTITLPNGLTPAEAVEYGANKNNVFKIQQSMNGDYGRRTMRNGGHCSRPVERNKFVTGGTLQYVNGMWQKRVNYPNSNNGYWQLITADEAAKLRKSGLTVNGSSSVNRNTTQRTVSQNNNTSKNSAVKNNTTRNNRNTSVNNSTNYSFGQARGNNIAPYEAIQIGATAPKLNTINVSTPSIDADFYTPSKSSKSTTSNPATSSSTPARSSSNRRRLRNRGNSSTSANKVPTSISEIPTTKQLLSIIPQNAAIATPSYTNPTEQVLRDMQEDANTKEVPVTTPVINSVEDYFNYYNNNLNYNQNTIGNQQLESQGITPEVKAPTVEDTTTRNNVQATPFKRYNTADWIGLGADLIGSLGSALINYNNARSLNLPPAPLTLMSGKLITNYNIAPRLAALGLNRNRTLRSANELLSSAGRLNAMNRINNMYNVQADQLWGEKTNREIELMNADTTNQQYLSAQSVQNYNAWLDRANQLMNYRKEKEGEALQYGLSGISDAAGNFLDQGRQNYADDQAMKYYAALLGDKGIEWLRRSGVNVRNGGRFILRNV